MKKVVISICSICLATMSIPLQTIVHANDILLGDINKDGVVDSFDSVKILQISIGIAQAPDDALAIADMNNDGIINSFDAVLTLKDSVNSGNIDTTGLQTLITNTESLFTKGYTKTSLDALKVVVNDAKKLIENVNVTEADINKAMVDINTKVNALKVDVAPLTTKISDMESKDLSIFKPSSTKTLTNLIANAKTLSTKANITFDEMNNMISNLESTYSSLELKEDTTSLKTKINELKNTDTTGYTTESIKEFKDLIVSIEKSLSNGDLTASEIKGFASQLSTALNILKVDKASLVIAIANAKTYYTGSYTQESLDMLKQMIASAESVNTNDSASIKNVNDAISNIQLAISGLKAGMTQEEAFNQLQSLVDEYIPELDRNDFTNETFKPFNDKMIELHNAIRKGDISKTTKVDILRTHYNELKTLYNNLEITTEATELANRQQALKDLCDLIDAKDFSLYADVDVMSLKRGVADTRLFMESSDFADIDYVNMNIDYLQRTLDAVRLNSALDHTTVYTADMSSMLAMLNAKRAENGLSSNITFDSELNKGATIRATEMSKAFSTDYDTAEKQFHLYAHQRPDFQTPCFTIENEVNYNGGIRGENAAMGSSKAEALFKAWVASPGHYAIMMDKDINQVGIACIKVGDHQWLAYMITGYNFSIPKTD